MLFLLLFAGFWGGVIAIAALGFKQGSPQTLLYGLDYDGHVCGKNNKARVAPGRAARALFSRGAGRELTLRRSQNSLNKTLTGNLSNALDLTKQKAQYWLNPNEARAPRKRCARAALPDACAARLPLRRR